MVVDRLGIAMLVAGTCGVVWMGWARPGANAAKPRKPTATHADLVPNEPILANGMEAMHGPYASLGGNHPDADLDVKVMSGIAPFQQLTVMHVGANKPVEQTQLGDFAPLELWVRVDGRWYFRQLGQSGVSCGGMGSPTWSDVEADAPKLVDTPHTPAIEVSIDVTETYSTGDTSRIFVNRVVCGVVEGTPACSVVPVSAVETTRAR